jgi:hypothetical protein
MRTILVLALAANVIFSAGANYLQTAVPVSQSASSNSIVASAASQSTGQVRSF